MGKSCPKCGYVAPPPKGSNPEVVARVVELIGQGVRGHEIAERLDLTLGQVSGIRWRHVTTLRADPVQAFAGGRSDG